MATRSVRIILELSSFLNHSNANYSSNGDGGATQKHEELVLPPLAQRQWGAFSVGLTSEVTTLSLSAVRPEGSLYPGLQVTAAND